jgi:hypothetical protein
VVNAGIDWPAWVQAVGSVVAIAAAIWIDHGAERRQRSQLAAADRQRERDRIELMMTVTTQAKFALQYTERAYGDFLGSQIFSDEATYNRWREVADDTAETLWMLCGRIADPILLTHVTGFRRAIRPPERLIATPSGVNHQAVIEDRLAMTRIAFRRLESYTQHVADSADPAILWRPVPQLEP